MIPTILLLIFSLNCINQALCVRCEYEINENGNYACYLNSNSANNKISGNHWPNKTDGDVQWISKVSDFRMKTLSKVICDKFRNLINIDLASAEIETIEENSLENCKNLEILRLNKNKIVHLPKTLSTNDLKLKELYLSNNKLVDLPANIFAPFIYLEKLGLHNNKLKTIHSDSFGNHTRLQQFSFAFNALTSLDEDIFNRLKSLKTIKGYSNVCVDTGAYFHSDNDAISKIKPLMIRCFDNYKTRESMLFTTTTIATSTESVQLQTTIKPLSDEEILLKFEDMISIIDELGDECRASIKTQRASTDEVIKKIQESFQVELDDIKNKIDILTKNEAECKKEIYSLKINNQKLVNDVETFKVNLKSELSMKINEQKNYHDKMTINIDNDIKKLFKSQSDNEKQIQLEKQSNKRQIDEIKNTTEELKSKTANDRIKVIENEIKALAGTIEHDQNQQYEINNKIATLDNEMNYFYEQINLLKPNNNKICN